MRNRATRIALALIMAVGLTAAGYQVVTLERRQSTVATAHEAFETLAIDVGSRLGSLKAAQQAYVAAGQGLDFWVQQTSTILDGLSLDLVELKRLTSSQESATAVGVIAQTIDNFVQLDVRVQDYAANGQVLMASDIIFTDGIAMIQGASESLAAARDDERRRAQQLGQATGQEQATVLASAAVGSLVIGLLLLPGGSRPTAADTSTETEPHPEGEEPAADSLGLSLGPIQPRRSAAGEAGSTLGQVPDLTDAAALCTDLARTLDANDLPRLLERTADLLGASGLIVWLSGRNNEPLRPILTHGYPAETVRRFGSIPRDGDNATAAACREVSLQTVAGDTENSGAIVAPLVTGHGCIGSLAVEIPPGVPIDETRQNLSCILASQLGLLLAEQPRDSQRDEGELRAHAQG